MSVSTDEQLVICNIQTQLHTKKKLLSLQSLFSHCAGKCCNKKRKNKTLQAAVSYMTNTLSLISKLWSRVS